VIGAATIPYAWYADEDVFRREQERIFEHAWHYAGHAGEVAGRGSYFTTQVGRIPLVVIRGRDDELRCFVNVCRHRGFEVAQGSGRRETLQCGYHAWTYDLDGSLRAAPRSDLEPGFDKEELGLKPAQVGRWGPFVFVNADADAPPLEETLGELPELVLEAGLDVDALAFNRRVEFELEANWKIVSENFLECYHCQVAHPRFSAMVDVSPDAYELDSTETFFTHRAPVRENGVAAYDLGANEIPRGQFHLVWPGIAMNIMPGRPNISIGPIRPLAPGRTLRFLDYFFAPAEDEAWIADYMAFDDQVGAEDRVLVESVQRGVASGALEGGRLLVSSEKLIADFGRRLAAALS
jgi:phenylpropionate dioxygenase-like ring-hydroxylating dioxygenase large terminal subunit